MKTLIEKSISIYGMGHPDVKTVFNLNTIPTLPTNATEEENRKVLSDIRYKSLTTISGRKLTVWFKYMENEIETQDKVQVTIPKIIL